MLCTQIRAVTWLARQILEEFRYLRRMGDTSISDQASPILDHLIAHDVVDQYLRRMEDYEKIHYTLVW